MNGLNMVGPRSPNSALTSPARQRLPGLVRNYDRLKPRRKTGNPTADNKNLATVVVHHHIYHHHYHLGKKNRNLEKLEPMEVQHVALQSPLANTVRDSSSTTISSSSTLVGSQWGEILETAKSASTTSAAFQQHSTALRKKQKEKKRAEERERREKDKLDAACVFVVKKGTPDEIQLDLRAYGLMPIGERVEPEKVERLPGLAAACSSAAGNNKLKPSKADRRKGGNKNKHEDAAEDDNTNRPLQYNVDPRTLTPLKQLYRDGDKGSNKTSSDEEEDDEKISFFGGSNVEGVVSASESGESAAWNATELPALFADAAIEYGIEAEFEKARIREKVLLRKAEKLVEEKQKEETEALTRMAEKFEFLENEEFLKKTGLAVDESKAKYLAAQRLLKAEDLMGNLDLLEQALDQEHDHTEEARKQEARKKLRYAEVEAAEVSVCPWL
eukprot:g4097.t1